LNVLANFSVGNLIYDGGQAFTDNLNGDFNKGTAVLDYWTTQAKCLCSLTSATRANLIVDRLLN
jgi:hypothetical protein